MKTLVIATLLASSTLVAAAPSKAPLSSVVGSDASFSLEDSYSLEKVAAAFEKVGPQVVYTIGRADAWAAWAPAPISPGSTFERPNMFRKLDSAECKGPGAVVAFGAEINPELYGGSVVFADHLCKGTDYKHLPAGTPVVVWGQRPDGWVVVLTLDGGRYEVEHLEDLKPGAGGAQAPSASLHGYVGHVELGHLAPKDPVAKTAYDALEEASRDYNKCAVPFFQKAEKQIAALPPLMADAPRNAKSAAINKSFNTQREKACGKHVTKYNQTLAGFLTDREAKRRALATSAARLLGK